MNNEQIQTIKDKYSAEHMSKYDLTGIGVGYKKIGGMATNQLAIVYMVKKKLPVNQIAEGQLIPSSLDGAIVDVVEIKEIKACALTARVRPAMPGYSCGHPLVTAGTLGCVVYDTNGNRYILSNNHVLANQNDATVGDHIYQPGVVDGGTDADTVAQLTTWVPIANGVNADCALAQITDPTLVQDIGYWGEAITSYTNPELNDVIYKTGRTSTTNFGILTYEHVDVSVTYDIGALTITDCFITTSSLQMQPGDSGSCARLDNNIAVGLGFAGDGSTASIFCYMSNVISALNPLLIYPLALSYINKPYRYSSIQSQGPNIPTTFTSSQYTFAGQNLSGTNAWNNPSYAGTTGSNFATMGPVTGTTTYSQLLKATGFNFSLPSNAFIQSIIVTLNCYATGTTSPYEITLVTYLGVQGGIDSSGGNPYYGYIILINPPTTAQVFSQSLGDSRYNSYINDPNFGVEIYDDTGADNPVAVTEFINSINMTVNYVFPITPPHYTTINPSLNPTTTNPTHTTTIVP